MLNNFINTFKTLDSFGIAELIFILLAIAILGILLFFAIFKPHRDESAIFNWKRILLWVAIMATVIPALMLRFVYDNQTTQIAGMDQQIFTNSAPRT